MSFLELYNEDMYDLLSANEDMNKLRLYEDPMVRGSVIINGIEDVIVTSKEQVVQRMSDDIRGTLKSIIKPMCYR